MEEIRSLLSRAWSSKIDFGGISVELGKPQGTFFFFAQAILTVDVEIKYTRLVVWRIYRRQDGQWKKFALSFRRQVVEVDFGGISPDVDKLGRNVALSTCSTTTVTANSFFLLKKKANEKTQANSLPLLSRELLEKCIDVPTLLTESSTSFESHNELTV